jgi:hypothetical protein
VSFTALTMAVQDPAGTSSWRVLVQETFEEVLEHVSPLTPPSSSLEARTRLTYTAPDGRPLMIRPDTVVHVEGGVED